MSFSSPSQSFHSPLIHGKLTKQTSDYPWIFETDSPELVVRYHEIDHHSNSFTLVGSSPLLLTESEGEEEF